MTYIPVVPHVPVEEASPRTRELADLLGRVIEEYEKHHPSLTGEEVRAAVQMASRSSGKAAQPAAVLAVVGLALLAAGLVAFFALQSAAPAGSGLPWRGLVMTFMGVIGVAFLTKRLSGR